LITKFNRAMQISMCLVGLLVLNNCNRPQVSTNPPPKPAGPTAAVATTSYEGEGKVIALKPKLPSIEIDHQEIKGLMPAMTMEFYVKDKSLLEGLKSGDQIAFSLDYGVGGLVITKITKK
jgi:Cu(I)/Ag(I) efflux system periplasmic protein CusF